MSEDLSTQKPPKALWPVFLWSLLALALFLVGTRALLSIPAAPVPEDAARSAERTKAWADLQVEDDTKLNTLAWSDKAKGAVQLPIDLAMSLTVQRMAGQTPRPVPSATPAPADAPAAPAPATDASVPPAPAPADGTSAGVTPQTDSTAAPAAQPGGN